MKGKLLFQEEAAWRHNDVVQCCCYLWSIERLCQ